MKSDRFDHLTAIFAQSVSRRGLLRSLAGLSTLLAAPAVRHAGAQSCADVRGMQCEIDSNCFPFDCPGYYCCGGVCTTIENDPVNCGGCGIVCSSVEECLNSWCQSTCPGSLVPCGDECVDYMSDPNNCGGCRDACPEDQVCRDGYCVSPCDPGQTLCGERCLNLNRNEENCGACGNVCPAGTACTQGECVSTCREGETLCGGVCIDLGSDDANCGECGKRCRGGRICRRGECVSPCEDGLTLCDGNCVDLGSDERNCGGCGEICPDGAACQGGACVCTAPLSLCGGRCVDYQADAANCSDCGLQCPPGAICIDGGCLLTEESYEEYTVRDEPGAEQCTAKPRAGKSMRNLASRLDEDPAPMRLTPNQANKRIKAMKPSEPKQAQLVLDQLQGAAGCANAGQTDAQLGAMNDNGALQGLRERGLRSGDKKIGALLRTVVPVPQRQRLSFLDAGEVFEDESTGSMLIRRTVNDPSFRTPIHQRLYRATRLDREIRLGDYMRILPQEEQVANQARFEIAVRVWICPPGMDETSFFGNACEPAQLERHFNHWRFFGDQAGMLVPLDQVQRERLGSQPSMMTVRSDTELVAMGVSEGWRGVVPGLILDPSLPAEDAPAWRLPAVGDPTGLVVDAYLFRAWGCGTSCPQDQVYCPGYVSSEPALTDATPNDYISPFDDILNCGGCGLTCLGDGVTCSGGLCLLCSQQVECATGLRWDDATCSCVSACDPTIDCTYGGVTGAFKLDPNSCECVCYDPTSNKCGTVCAFGGCVCDEATSTCQCPEGTEGCGNICIPVCDAGKQRDWYACTCV